MPTVKKIESITFNVTRHKLNGFFIFGWFKMYTAKILEITPINATKVLVIPSNQNAILSIEGNNFKFGGHFDSWDTSPKAK